jgi:ABC-type phosphate/phosphonate transport system permease subunit
MKYMFDFSVIVASAGDLLFGCLPTLQISMSAMLIGILTGVLVVARRADSQVSQGDGRYPIRRLNRSWRL